MQYPCLQKHSIYINSTSFNLHHVFTVLQLSPFQSLAMINTGDKYHITRGSKYLSQQRVIMQTFTFLILHRQVFYWHLYCYPIGYLIYACLKVGPTAPLVENKYVRILSQYLLTPFWEKNNCILNWSKMSKELKNNRWNFK